MDGSYRMNGGGVSEEYHAIYAWSTYQAATLNGKKLLPETELALLSRWFLGLWSDHTHNAAIKPADWDFEKTRDDFDETWSDVMKGCHHYIFFKNWRSTGGLRSPQEVVYISKWLDFIAGKDTQAHFHSAREVTGLEPSLMDDRIEFCEEMRDYYGAAARHGFAVLES